MRNKIQKKRKEETFTAAAMMFCSFYIILAAIRIQDIIKYSFINFSVTGIVWTSLDIASALFAALTILILGVCRKYGSGNSKHLMLAVFFASIGRVAVISTEFVIGLYPSREWIGAAFFVLMASFIVLYLMIGLSGDKLMGCNFKEKKRCMKEFHEAYRAETHNLWNHIMDMKRRLDEKKKVVKTA